MKDIKDGVKDTYDAIAPFFSKNRTSIWPPTASFIDTFSPCRLLDLGCGTGRVILYALKKGCSVTGVDISPAQLDMTERNIEDAGIDGEFRLVEADMEDLPMEDMIFENCTMIASLHHLPTREARIESLREACRVLKSGGSIQISVWTWDQERFRERHRERIEGRRERDDTDGPEPGDLFVPWKDGRKKNRFYHLYGPGELEDEVSKTDLVLQRSYFDGRNHWLEAEKP